MLIKSMTCIDKILHVCYTRYMSVKEAIIDIFADSPSTYTAVQISEIIGVSRPYASQQLNTMVKSGILKSERISKNVFYSLPDHFTIFEASLSIAGLTDNEVWRRFKDNPTLLTKTTENARGVLQFAFTEMLNNAIDHSKSSIVHIKVDIDGQNLIFSIRDFGIGVFRNIVQEKHLPDEITAIQELMKGKLTTAIRAHSGEGIFWTSKCAQKFMLISYDFLLSIDNTIHDYYIKKLPEVNTLKGTEVKFEMPVDTHVSLGELFKSFAATSEPGDLSLGATTIHLKLYDASDLWISRSQAKRILTDLDKFKRIIFDFSGVEIVGQAFCDEIFRIYRREHPDVKLEPVNMNESVSIMVNRALNDPTWD